MSGAVRLSVGFVWMGECIFSLYHNNENTHSVQNRVQLEQPCRFAMFVPGGCATFDWVRKNTLSTGGVKFNSTVATFLGSTPAVEISARMSAITLDCEQMRLLPRFLY
jgi:hypothetical protein